jgi:hypothetical protein
MAPGRLSLYEKWLPENFLKVKELPARKVDNFTVFCEPIVQKMWEPQLSKTLWATTAYCRDNFTLLHFTFYNFIIGGCILLRMYQISKYEYKQPSFATVIQRALLYTWYTVSNESCLYLLIYFLHTDRGPVATHVVWLWSRVKFHGGYDWICDLC